MLNYLNQKLGFIYEIYVRQSVNEGLALIAFGWILLMLSIYLFSKSKKIEWDILEDDAKVGLLIGGFLALTFSLICYSIGFLHIANPQYYAINEMLNYLK